MAWIGGLAGLILGLVFHSWGNAFMLAVVGGVGGYIFSQSRKNLKRIEPVDNARPALESKVQALQEQLLRMSERIAALERRLNASGPATPPIADLPAPHPLVEEIQPQQTIAANIATVDVALQHVEPPVQEEVPAAPLPEAIPEPVALQATPAEEAPELIAVPPKEIVNQQKPRPVAAIPAAPAVPTLFQSFVQKWIIGGNPLVKIGVLILFLGLAFLLRYATEHAVVPVEWRYAGVAATGIGLLLFGWRWRLKRDNYGLILQGAGIGVLYLTTFAAMKLHPLVPVEMGFVLLIGIAVFAALLAILQDALALAIVATAGGFAAPVMASTGHGNHVALFSYLTLLNLGIVAVAWFKAWRVLNLLGFIGTFALGSAWAARSYKPEMFSSTEPFLLLFFALYVLIAFLFARRMLAEGEAVETAVFGDQVRHAAAQVGYVHGTLVFGVPFAAFGLQYLLVRPFEYGAAFSALGFGLFYVVLAIALFRGAGKRYLLLTETLMALGVVFGSLSIPLGLEQVWTSAAWAVEAAGVYWVGVRQQRVHARLFALLLLIGSAIYFVLGVRIDSVDIALSGSPLGCLLLAAGIWWTYRLMRNAPPELFIALEHRIRPFLACCGALFVCLSPFLVLRINWAGPALAALGTVGMFAALRLPERVLLHCGWIAQALAGGLFLGTLRSAEGGSVLSNGWTGLLAVSLIGASMLAGVWVLARQSLNRVSDNAAPAAQISTGASIGLLAGLVFVNLAPLFVLPWHFAAMIWPLTGIATLWWAVQMGHAGTIVFALVLQVIGGIAHFGSRLFAVRGQPDIEAAKPFVHSGFFGPVLIALAAFACARLLQRRRQPGSLEVPLGWIALAWSGAWWAFAWAAEIVRVVPSHASSAVLAAVAVCTALACIGLTVRWQWRELGIATLAYLPALVLIAAFGFDLVHPLQSWGALAWPCALLAHLLLVRRQEEWAPRALVQFMHVLGVWLFVTQAAIELRWWFAQWGEVGSAWPLLGWMLAPVAYLWGITRERAQQHWPLRDWRDAYMQIAAAPIVLYLFAWVWIGNIISAGTASPLPYVPLLNPLEIAQAAVLLGALLWWQSLRGHPLFAQAWPLGVAVSGSTALAVLTGIVVRTCHHWTGVEWDVQAMLDSNVFQTAISIVWSIVAIGLMMTGNRSGRRWIWITGAALMGVVVVKLFLIELAAQGSLARIVSFIVVGVLLLLVGYFAPLPPKRPAIPHTEDVASS